MYSHSDSTQSSPDLSKNKHAPGFVYGEVDLANKQGDLLSVAYRRISDLRPYKGNARTHSNIQIRKIAESIRTFGFTNPVLINASDMIVAGHGRVDAAKLLGHEQVPTIRLDNLTPDQIRAYVLADNRLALDAGWDNEILKIELQHLAILAKSRSA